MRILRGNSNRYQVRVLAVALLAVLGFVAAGYGGAYASSAPKSGVEGAQHSTSSVAVKTRKITGLGHGNVIIQEYDTPPSDHVRQQ